MCVLEVNLLTKTQTELFVCMAFKVRTRILCYDSKIWLQPRIRLL